jgi:excisionase family DNA binding protein
MMRAIVNRRTPLNDLPELLHVEEAADWLDVKPGLLYSLIRRGDFHAVRFGRKLRISRESLQEYISRDTAQERTA